MPTTYLHWSKTNPSLTVVIERWQSNAPLSESDLNLLIGYLQEWIFDSFWNIVFSGNSQKLQHLEGLRQSFALMAVRRDRQAIEEWLQEVHQLSIYPLEGEDYGNPNDV